MTKLLERALPIVAGLLASAQAWAQGDGAPASPTAGWNHLWRDILVDIFTIGAIFAAAAVYLLLRYRAKSLSQVGSGPVLTRSQMWAWAVIPAALFMADDFLLSAKGWSLWNIQREVPGGAMEVKVTASQWFFEFEYDNGVTSNELIVPVGRPIVLRMTATDVIHSFGISEYRLKEDIMPGRVTYLWFYPDKPLESPVVCVEFCGVGHSQMSSKVKAVPKAEFAAWLDTQRRLAALGDGIADRPHAN